MVVLSKPSGAPPVQQNTLSDLFSRVQELLLILVVARFTNGRISHWSMIRAGLFLAALSPLPVAAFGATLTSTCAFVPGA